MSDNTNTEVIKFFAYIIIGIIGFVAGITLKFLYALKKTIEKMFERINKNENDNIELRARCDERHKKRGK